MWERREIEKLLYTTAEVASLLSVHRMTVRNMINRGELPVVRIGRSVRIPADAVLAFVNRSRTDTKE